MVVHLVMFRLKPGIDREDPRAVKVDQLMRALPERIPGILAWQVGWNFSDRPIAYDYGLYSTFADQSALADYVPHPAHQEAVSIWKEIAEWNICDFQSN